MLNLLGIWYDPGLLKCPSREAQSRIHRQSIKNMLNITNCLGRCLSSLWGWGVNAKSIQDLCMLSELQNPAWLPFFYALSESASFQSHYLDPLHQHRLWSSSSQALSLSNIDAETEFIF